MASNLKDNLLSLIPYLFTDRAGLFIARRSSKGLTEEVLGEASEKFLQLLLGGMNLALCLCKDYRKNVKGFEGRYLFASADGLIATSARFAKGNLEVREGDADDWNVKVTFKDAAAFRDFMFSQNHDILDSVLRNDVELEGNPNYIYKFGFLARDLMGKLGAA